jgi:hypothetical protein
MNLKPLERTLAKQYLYERGAARAVGRRREYCKQRQDEIARLRAFRAGVLAAYQIGDWAQIQQICHKE